jgi:ERCC4-related helicase
LSTGSQQHFDAFGLARQQTIHQLIGRTELQPMARETVTHPKAMAAVFGLLKITRSPGPLQKNHMSSTMQREAKGSSAIRCQQAIAFSLLKTIHRLLTFKRTLSSCHQFPTNPLMQQLKRCNKRAEQHNSVPLLMQLVQQLFGSRQLEFRSYLTHRR